MGAADSHTVIILTGASRGLGAALARTVLAEGIHLVAVAREWGAALVTGDRHLLDLPAMPAVMTPRQFLRLLA